MLIIPNKRSNIKNLRVDINVIINLIGIVDDKLELDYALTDRVKTGHKRDLGPITHVNGA